MPAVVKHRLVAPCALVAVFAGLVAWELMKNSTWFDESYSILLVAPNGFRQIAARTAVDGHPPLWYWVEKLWFAGFGESLFALRLSSAVFMLSALGVWYHFIRSRFSRGLALLTLALAVTNPMMLHYAVEGRMYAFAILLVGIATLLATSTWRWRWYAYWPIAVAMLYTHYFLAFVLAAHFVWLCTRRLPLWWIVVYGGSIVAAFAPWVPFAVHQTQTIVTEGFWIAPVTPVSVLQYIDHAFLHRSDFDLSSWKVFPAVVFTSTWIALMVRAARRTADGAPTALLWCMAVVPPAFLFVLSCKPLVPVFHPRYVVFGLPAVIALLAIGARNVVSQRRRFAAIAVLFAGQAVGLVTLRSRGFADVRDYYTMAEVAPIVARPVDGEVPPVVATWQFGFFDAKATLWGSAQQVVIARPAAPAFDHSDAIYYDRPTWWTADWTKLPARHVWIVEPSGQALAVPAGWQAAPGADYTLGYAHARRFDRVAL